VRGPASHVAIGIARRLNQGGQRAQRVHFCLRLGRVPASKVDEDKRRIASHLNVDVAECSRQCANGFIAESAQAGGDFTSSLFQRIDSSVASRNRPTLHRNASHLLHETRSVALENEDGRSCLHYGRNKGKAERE
jgi:hypothetical protein